MGGKCVAGNVIYEGAVTRQDTGQTEYYTGLSEPSWKLRWNNHKTNFKIDTKANRTATCLSKHIWKLKDKQIKYSIKFKQLAKASSFNPVNSTCRLCLTEKYFIMFKPEGATINSRDEFFSSCRHKTKLLLCQPHKKKTSWPHSNPFVFSPVDHSQYLDPGEAARPHSVNILWGVQTPSLFKTSL